MAMALRIGLIGLLLAAISGITVTPAAESCYPEKPQTCRTCHLNDVYIDESGNVVLDWECP